MSRSKIYTKTGDSGETSLYGGTRVSKADQIICVLGSIDELNASIGVARSLGKESHVDAILSQIQNDLFVVGAEIAARSHSNTSRIPSITPDHTKLLEEWIDKNDATLPPLTNFILPGGSPAGAELHRARAVCRRAERELAHLYSSIPSSPELVRYLNRLSDMLFVAARLVNTLDSVTEHIWKTSKTL